MADQFARLVRHHRLRLKLTQEMLAERTKISVRSIGELERGRSNPRPHTVDALASALELTGTVRDDFRETGLAKYWHSRSGRPERRLPQVQSGPAQLPAAASGLAGRSQELRQLDDLAEHAHVVAVVGAAGVGKTFLAVAWAQRNRRLFPDGQLFVDLRGFDPVGQAVAPFDALRVLLVGLGVRPGDLPAELDERAALYRSLLAGKRVLVLLDNAHDADQVRPLLAGGEGCLAVVTSRDQLWSLVAIDGARSVAVPSLSEQDALDLLHMRLGPKRVYADPSAATEVVRLCAALPLALTIAAAVTAGSRAASLRPLADDLATADRRLDVLGGWDQASDIRAAFACSYQRLSKPAAELFRFLGLHPAAEVSLAGAASLTGAAVARVGASIAELVHAHLLEPTAPGRYRQHELLRAYARELVLRNEPTDRQHSARLRLLDHYLHGANIAGHLLNPSRHATETPPLPPQVTLPTMSDASQAMTWFQAERDCLLAAVELAGEVGSATHAWQISSLIAGFLTRQGFWREQVDVLEKALAAARQLDDETALAHTHRRLGVALAVRGAAAEAREHYRQALVLFAQLDDNRGQAHTLRNLAWLSEQDGQDRESLAFNERALNLYRHAADKGGQSRALNRIGWDHARLGNFDQALTFCLQAVPLMRETGDTHGEAITLDTVGYAHYHLGDHAQAIACFHRALDLMAPAGDRYNEAEVHLHLADAMTSAGDPGAEAHRRRALQILDELGHPRAQEIRCDV